MKRNTGGIHYLYYYSLVTLFHHLMPYIIALAVLVVVGVGFALFQNSNTEQESLDTNAITVEERIPAETATPTDSVATEPAPQPEQDDNVAEEIPVPTNTVIETPTPEPVVVVPSSDYADGSYTTSVTYKTPERDEYSMDVTLTIANDKVIDSNIVYGQKAIKDSNVKRFNSAYEAQVIGKDMDTISLSRVGGASLTTKAFNNALAKIKLDAGA